MDDFEKEAKQLQNEYVREWRKKNRDKVQRYNKSYWLKKAQKARVERDAKENT